MSGWPHKTNIMLLKDFDQAHKEFCETAFPDINDYRKPLEHMKLEIQEAITSGEPEEFADILMLLLSAFRLRFPKCNTDDLLSAAASKLIINRERTWEMNLEGFAQHVKH